MKNVLKKILAVVCVFAMLFVLSSCEKQSGRTVTFNTKYVAFDAFMSVIIKEKGLLEKYIPDDVSIEWTEISSNSEERDAMVSGSVDIGNLSVINFSNAIQNGMPLVYIAYEGANIYQLYTKNTDIHTIKDLKPSDKISVSSIGTGAHAAFLIAAQKDTGSINQFSDSMIAMANSDAVTGLLSGVSGLDAVVCTFPTIISAWNDSSVHMIRDLSDEIKEYGIGVAFCTTEKFAKENPDIIDAVIKAREDAVNLLRNNKEECIALMMDVYENVDKKLAQTMIDYYLESIDNGEGKYDMLLNYLYEIGMLEQKATPFDDIPRYKTK